MGVRCSRCLVNVTRQPLGSRFGARSFRNVVPSIETECPPPPPDVQTELDMQAELDEDRLTSARNREQLGAKLEAITRRLRREGGDLND